jgi:hypothetical protein
MKKIFATGLLAICAIALTQQEASAWVNSRFSIGLSWNYQSGGNSFLWGAIHNGQVPGPEAYYGGGQVEPMYPSYAPYYGHQHHHSYAPTYQGAYTMPTQQSAYVQPTYAPLYHGATFQRPGR